MTETTDNTIPGAYAATGRRKNAVCRVNLADGKGEILINGREKLVYLCRESLVRHAMEPLETVNMVGRLDITASVKGGGLTGQAGAMRLALARALARYNPDFRGDLKKAGLLSVDARQVERKKYGRPKARKRFQFSKR